MADRDLVRKDRQSSNTSSPPGINYLLAIAINDYLHCSKLSNAVRDVEAFIELLTTRYHFDPEHVTFIKDTDATEKRIRRAFDRLIDVVTEQDNLIVYFSGHGRHHERRGGYWIPVEAGTSDEDWSDYIPNDTIKSYLGKIKSFHTFLIADSCFSGSLFIDKSKEKFSGDRRDTEPSRWGLTSGKKEIVSDGHPGQHSPFATALLDVLRKADQPPGVMRICDLVLEKVAANAEQTPMGSPLQVLGHQGGQLVLYFREGEEEEWSNLCSTLEGCEQYLDKYPNGKYQLKAKDMILDYLESHQQIWSENSRIGKKDIFVLPRKTGNYNKGLIRINKYKLFFTVACVASLTYFSLNSKPTEKKHPQVFVSSFRSEMRLIKGDTFVMGDVFKDETGISVELVSTQVNDFYISNCELTFAEFDAFCQATDRRFPKDYGWGRHNLPVIDVSWFDAIEYCNWRSREEGLNEVYKVTGRKIAMNSDANGYRLPTEAEWEYAAREYGKAKRFGNGTNVANPKELNYNAFEGFGQKNTVGGIFYRNKTVPVDSLKTNALGLYNMSGNVHEWCWDRYNQSFPSNYKALRVCRGGSWNSVPSSLRTSSRVSASPLERLNVIGFRVAKNGDAL
ncbi:SUMF1/EgtB/PvdO family nonheme iron enzyme [Haliscomenobacter hydrossis]|uniref:Sulphatase-modifying factor protein n=1 Tax=Haliscomenobacter hydrossis (strain ATCC 27775 / DSM 1100 / LMG 10767 / O) TaxID=760192 RepID=F4L866_HALH1|nr:SUMF1/EgtB/PvdO family nonheme iron enzyme [Haliscomenobacter hydrossis]AEE54574.1 Sulphatase-modifying factor protein [Haliscomenobacter hydrossis DSM 1100]